MFLYILVKNTIIPEYSGERLSSTWASWFISLGLAHKYRNVHFCLNRYADLTMCPSVCFYVQVSMKRKKPSILNCMRRNINLQPKLHIKKHPSYLSIVCIVLTVILSIASILKLFFRLAIRVSLACMSARLYGHIFCLSSLFLQHVQQGSFCFDTLSWEMQHI